MQLNTQAKFGMFRHPALIEYDRAFRIDATGHVGGRHDAGGIGQFRRSAPDLAALRDRMQVDHAVDALVRVLQLDPLHHRAEIVTEVKITGWLHAGKHARCDRGQIGH